MRIVSRPSDRASARATPCGRVTLVGAGPGDPELLTLKAIRSLQTAEVILFDDLVSDAVLEFARPETECILVGKRCGRPSFQQDDINDLMVKLAKGGSHVVRLKSGDPMIFGRAGEEIARLDAEGIPVEIVPGITAGIAMAAAMGVSLTHRDCARSVRFVTGHSREGGLPEDLDWKAIADPSTTTIFYMAGRTAGQIADRLMAQDVPPETGAVVATAVSRSGQRVRPCTLETLRAQVEAARTSDPVIVGIGAVFDSRRRRGIATHSASAGGAVASFIASLSCAAE